MEQNGESAKHANPGRLWGKAVATIADAASRLELGCALIDAASYRRFATQARGDSEWLAVRLENCRGGHTMYFVFSPRWPHCGPDAIRLAVSVWCAGRGRHDLTFSDSTLGRAAEKAVRSIEETPRVEQT